MTNNLVKLTKKDFESNQDVRWCPGCGDYVILSTVQPSMPELGPEAREHRVRQRHRLLESLSVLHDTFGMHTIHGRAPAVGDRPQAGRPELVVWVITGDGDGLSIGGNHLIHALRRNVNMTIMLFNNQIYGLTKGQYSPTSAVGTKAASTPAGSVDMPLSPLVLALGAGASFVARVADTDAKLMLSILERAYHHKGSVLIEMLQNCPVFNDGIWDAVKDDAPNHQLVLTDGQPLTFAKGTKGIRLGDGLVPEVVDVTPENQGSLLVHRERNSLAMATLLASMSHPAFPVPVGVLHKEDKPVYADNVHAQIAEAIAAQGRGDVQKLLNSGMTWDVGEGGVKH
jgi:2-oxoglutarate ferredoxin oxidoreductase subunit beta